MIGRIQDRAGFERLRRDGTRIRIDPLWCTFLADPELDPARVAFAIGRATGNAVTRNRLRRRLRAILGTSAVPSGLLLVGARPDAVELTFDELRRSIDAMLAAMQERVRS